MSTFSGFWERIRDKHPLSKAITWSILCDIHGKRFETGCNVIHYNRNSNTGFWLILKFVTLSDRQPVLPICDSWASCRLYFQTVAFGEASAADSRDINWPAADPLSTSASDSDVYCIVQKNITVAKSELSQRNRVTVVTVRLAAAWSS